MIEPVAVADAVQELAQPIQRWTDPFVIDSNIARFINRYYGLQLEGEIRRKKGIIEKAKELFNIREPGTFLFAILDFTYKVCTARNPGCSNCVIASYCRGKQEFVLSPGIKGIQNRLKKASCP